MNKLVLIGRVVADPDLKYTQSGIAVAQFALAVQDDFKKQDGTRDTHFFDVVAWRGTAEFVTNHSGKGKRLAVAGRLKQERWEKDGQKRSKVVVSAENVMPIDWADDNDGSSMDIADEDVPF